VRRVRGERVRAKVGPYLPSAINIAKTENAKAKKVQAFTVASWLPVTITANAAKRMPIRVRPRVRTKLVLSSREYGSDGAFR